MGATVSRHKIVSADAVVRFVKQDRFTIAQITSESHCLQEAGASHCSIRDRYLPGVGQIVALRKALNRFSYCED